MRCKKMLEAKREIYKILGQIVLFDVKVDALTRELDCRGGEIVPLYTQVCELSKMIQKRVSSVQTEENLIKRPFVFKTRRFDQFDKANALQTTLEHLKRKATKTGVLLK